MSISPIVRNDQLIASDDVVTFAIMTSVLTIRAGSGGLSGW